MRMSYGCTVRSAMYRSRAEEMMLDNKHLFGKLGHAENEQRKVP